MILSIPKVFYHSKTQKFQKFEKFEKFQKFQKISKIIPLSKKIFNFNLKETKPPYGLKPFSLVTFM